MNHQFRLFVAAGVSLTVLLLILISVARQEPSLLGPLNLLLFLLAILIYLLPSIVAFFRECESALWITLLNVFLGWTVLGWFIAIGWAAGGRVKPMPPRHPLPTH